MLNSRFQGGGRGVPKRVTVQVDALRDYPVGRIQHEIVSQIKDGQRVVGRKVVEGVGQVTYFSASEVFCI